MKASFGIEYIEESIWTYAWDVKLRSDIYLNDILRNIERVGEVRYLLILKAYDKATRVYGGL